MSVTISYNDATLVTIEDGERVTLHTRERKIEEEIQITAVKTNSVPVEVTTEAEMTALLETAEVGSVYLYTGATTDTYENGQYYIVIEE